MEKLTKEQEAAVVEAYLKFKNSSDTFKSIRPFVRDFIVYHSPLTKKLISSGEIIIPPSKAKQRSFYKQVITKDQIPTIVKMVNSGDYTLEQVGTKFGVSRERIRQIYKKVTGNPARQRIYKLKALRSLEKEAYQEQIKFSCESCGKLVKNKDAKFLRKLCRECRDIQKDNRCPWIDLNCQFCGKKFHPNRIFVYQNKVDKAKFCSFQCWKDSFK